MTTTTGSLGDSVKPLFGLGKQKMAKSKKSGGGGGGKPVKQPSGGGTGVAQTQSKGNRLETLPKKKGY